MFLGADMFRVILPVIEKSRCFVARGFKNTKNKSFDKAGLRQHYKVFGEVNELEQDPEQGVEADFSQLHLSHRAHKRELALRREQTKYYVIRHKYFRTEKQPNFLTWAEKEQIRHLHKTEPDEWTSERLAESFPAVESVIIKIINATWTPSNMKRIQKHDESTKRNWELFKANQMTNLDPEVREHLQKFSNRNFDNIQNAYTKTNNEQIEFQFPKPKSREFLHLIESCNRNKAKDESKASGQIEVNDKQDQLTLPSAENALRVPKKKRKQLMTYEDLVETNIGKINAVKDEEIHLSVSLPEQPTSPAAASTASAETELINNPADITSDVTYADQTHDNEVIDLTTAAASSSKKIEKFATKTVSIANFAEKNPTPLQTKIVIPPELRKRGSTYKLNDCFYDNRGNFLYRVPGLMD